MAVYEFLQTTTNFLKLKVQQTNENYRREGDVTEFALWRKLIVVKSFPFLLQGFDFVFR